MDEPTSLPWSDEPSVRWCREAARNLRPQVVPACDGATEIVLDGRCPRCLHPTVSTHPIRAVVSPDAARALAAADEASPPDDHAIRRVVAECSCAHEHSGTPDGGHGCGASFAVWVSWSEATCTRSRWRRRWRRFRRRPPGEPRVVARLRPARVPSALDVEEERTLRTAAATQLADVRKAAESWRTGLAGFLAVLAAVFFIKGKSSFADIGGTGLKEILAGLLLFSATVAVYGAYRALRAAYGTPRDEYLGEVPWLFRELPGTTPRYVHDYGTVSAWRHAAARTAVNDLRQAKVATVASLTAFAAAAGITWFAPGPPAAASLAVTYTTRGGTATTCGKPVASSERTVTIKPPKEEAKAILLSTVVSLDVVARCP